MSIRTMITFALLGISTVIFTGTITGSAAGGKSEEGGSEDLHRSAEGENEEGENEEGGNEEGETEQDEIEIDMIAARSVVKDLIVGLMEIVLNTMVKDLQSLNNVSSLLINDFMFEEFQKEIVEMMPGNCNTFRDLIDSYNKKFAELLGACGLNTTDHSRAIERNTPMHAHLQNLRTSCGVHDEKVILSNGSKKQSDLLDMDRGEPSNLDEEQFPLGQAIKDVTYLLGQIMELSLTETSYYFISHHTNLHSYSRQVAKKSGPLIIELMEEYRSKFWFILDAANKDVLKYPLKDELFNLRNYCIREKDHDDSNPERQHVGGRAPEPETVARPEAKSSSSRPLRRAISKISFRGK